MKRAGVKGEKITFIFDESNVLGPAFLEKMNALLASGEIPGLFEGDELNKLNQEITGGDFQTKKFKPNKEKAKLIVSEAHGIRKIIRTKIKT